MAEENLEGGVPLQGGLVSRLSHAAALFGGFVVLATGGLVVVSILARWLFSTALPGDVELIQTATAVAAFAFLPIGQVTRSTIVVDTFTKNLSPRTCQFIDALWDALNTIIALLLAWRLAVGALDALHNSTVTTVLGLPIGWPMLLSTILLFLLSAAGVATLMRELRGSA